MMDLLSTLPNLNEAYITLIAYCEPKDTESLRERLESVLANHTSLTIVDYRSIELFKKQVGRRINLEVPKWYQFCELRM